MTEVVCGFLQALQVNSRMYLDQAKAVSFHILSNRLVIIMELFYAI
jgi:hypothetical protein